MAMADDEFKKNLKIQALKAHVNAAECAITAGSENYGSIALQKWVVAVSSSIAKRTSLESLGTDPGHVQRIANEQGFLSALRAEQAVRDGEASAARDARNSAAMSDLPANATWGNSA